MTQRFFIEKASPSPGQRNSSWRLRLRLSSIRPRSLSVRTLPEGRGINIYSRRGPVSAPLTVGPVKSLVVHAAAVVAIASTLALVPALPSLSQSTTAYPLLNVGSTGESVSSLQAILKLMGFYQEAVTGTYDAATQAAVSQFQTAAGISADGVVGQSTWQKLLPSPEGVDAVSASPVPAAQPVSQPAPETVAAAEPVVPSGPPVLRLNAEGPAVAQLQRELQTLDYYDGLIDGGFGEQTLQAVEAFQADQQLTVDGVVGASTWDALSEALGQ